MTALHVVLLVLQKRSVLQPPGDRDGQLSRVQYLLISAIALTLYDYLLMFDDEVRRENLNA